METTRQKKIAGVLQNDLTMILQKLLNSSSKNSTILSVTKVKVSTDLSQVKIYVSIFPIDQAKSVFELIETNKSSVKNSMGILIRNQVRRIPSINFFLDDSLDYIDKIEKALEKKSDPLKDNSLIEKRKFI